MAVPVVQTVKDRPAESATPVAMAVAVLIAKVAGVTDASTIAYIAIVISFVPAAVSWAVDTYRAKKK